MNTTIERTPSLKRGDALIIVDVQRDFCSGGALAVPGGDDIVPLLNRWIAAAQDAGVPIFFSRDWHPQNHISFKERGGDWPPHCIQDRSGARFHPDLNVPESAHIVTKGARFDMDQNSAFEQTGLAAELRAQGVHRLWVGGLAQDVCVRATVLDAVKDGFDVHVIEAATRPVRREQGAEALREMHEAGATIEQGVYG